MHFKTKVSPDTQEGKRWLDAGEVVGIPTETVYGLAGNALDTDAVLKIFTVKARPHFDPLIVHVSSVGEIEKYVTEIPSMARDLMARFMPGPLTLLLKKKALIPDLVTSGLDRVAIRVPSHPVTLELLRQLTFPLAAPSANPFGYISPTSAQHVLKSLGGKIPYILDGGPTPVGVESTIVGFDEGETVLYRHGGLPVEEIEKVAGTVRESSTTPSRPLAPGNLKSHYAPKKKLVFGKPGEISKLVASELQGKKFAIVAFDKYVPGLDHKFQVLLSSTGDLNEAARNLFAILRQLDEGDAGVICAVEFPNKGLGLAINDRLRRAAS